MDLNWVGHEDLFLRLLRLRNAHLAWCLLEKMAMGPAEPKIGILDIGDISWWLDWLSQAEDPVRTQWWFRDRLSKLFAMKLAEATQKAFLAEFTERIQSIGESWHSRF